MPVTRIDKHFMELLAPKQSSAAEGDFDKFVERYGLFLEHDYLICVTDNPMGNLSFMAPEMIEALELPVCPENLMIHLNTFHRKTAARFEPGKEQNEQDLDILLQHAQALGVKYLLCVSGDGSERLPRLKPEDLGYDPARLQTVTSVQLMAYITGQYPGCFTMGVAFNQYEPLKEEMEKLQRKLAAGAEFLITQPVAMDASADPRIAQATRNLAEMMSFADAHGVQVILEVWMSKKLAYLLPECVGHEIDFGDFDPESNFRAMRTAFPGRKFYFSMVFGGQTLSKVEGML